MKKSIVILILLMIYSCELFESDFGSYSCHEMTFINNTSDDLKVFIPEGYIYDTYDGDEVYVFYYIDVSAGEEATMEINILQLEVDDEDYHDFVNNPRYYISADEDRDPLDFDVERTTSFNGTLYLTDDNVGTGFSSTYRTDYEYTLDYSLGYENYQHLTYDINASGSTYNLLLVSVEEKESSGYSENGIVMNLSEHEDGDELE